MGIESLPRGGLKPFPILLVNPGMGAKEYTREDRLRSYLSLGTLASALGDNFFLKKFAALSGRKGPAPGIDGPLFEVQILNLSLKPPGQTVQGNLQGFLKEKGTSPFLIGTTATSGQWVKAREIAEAARRLIPDALRIIGGPHATVFPEEFLRSSEFQVACLGEGVETITELSLTLIECGRGKIDQVSGIAFKEKNGEIRMNPPRRFLMPLDDYPPPSESLDLFLDDGDDGEKNSRSLLCSILWGILDRGFSRISFESERENTGEELNGRLETITTLRLNRHLELLDRGIKIEDFDRETVIGGEQIRAWGIHFSFNPQDQKLIANNITDSQTSPRIPLTLPSPAGGDGGIRQRSKKR